MDSSLQRNEIEQFLFDVRDHFRASLETSEYENASNLFHMTAAEATEKLLQRCEQLLEQCSCSTKTQPQRQHHVAIKEVNGTPQTAVHMSNGTNTNAEDVSYLDMTACNNKKTGSREYLDFNNSADSDRTFRCSTRHAVKSGSYTLRDGATTEEDESDDEDEDEDVLDPQIYDICLVSQVDTDETEKVISNDLDLGLAVSCPYKDLPAGHLAIQNSFKYGQLQRIEKRLFFDQTKKCFCGILNDWLLCYMDGPTSSRPSLTLHLKGHGIEIEHSGEGKRRETCFQITTAADPNKKFVFQAINEVDAKEWIHAIEAAIRGDSATVMKNARKLPTPPVLKRMTFVSGNGNCNGSDHSISQGGGDCIYEEPAPLYHVHEPTEVLIGKRANEKSVEEKPPELPEKLTDALSMDMNFEYDVPKCPAQPIKSCAVSNAVGTEAGILLTAACDEVTSSVNGSSTPKSHATSRSSEQLDFQSKVKDVHSKLSSQLSAGSSPTERLKKAAKKTYSNSSNDCEAIALTTTPPPSVKDQKKQKKSNTPTASPQKNQNGTTNNNNNSSSSEKSAKNWFMNRLNKTSSMTRSSSTTSSSPAKCKQSEKENLLNSLEMCDELGPETQPNSGSNPTSPILKVGGAKSKVNMIINQFEASGHLVSTMFSVEALAGNAMASFSSFCDSDCNNYEPIMTVSTPPSSFMKKV